MPSRPTATMQQRVEEAVREIGVLLIVFAPLDAAFSAGPETRGLWLPFLLIGLLLFVAAIFTEWSHTRGR